MQTYFETAVGINDENNSRVALPVYCGFDEEELLSEQYKKQRVIP